MAARKKTKISGSVRANVYRIMDEAVENGVRYGWRRAHKHTETPDEDMIVDEINRAVMSELCEYLIFDDEAGS